MYYVGVDVQVRRGCPYYIIDDGCRWVTSGWLTSAADAPRELAAVVEEFRADGVAVGIDAPRAALATRRSWTWSGTKRRWVHTAAGAVGRHAEIVVKAFGLANPQWTLESAECVPWMQLGFSLFRELGRDEQAHEVFPSAAYKQLQQDTGGVELVLRDAFPGPRDLLDAVVAAYTVREYVNGRGTAVGGGDGLGTIILPRPLPSDGPNAVLTWPGGTGTEVER